jgi:hypothetical protein
VIELLSTEAHAPDDDLLRFSTALGEHIGQFLERQRAEEQLEEQRRIADEQRRRAEEANAAKDRFIAVLSHELRTPLTPVLFWACSTLENQGMPAELQEDLRMVRRNIQLEARLIDDLLEFTRLAMDRLESSGPRNPLTRFWKMPSPRHVSRRSGGNSISPPISAQSRCASRRMPRGCNKRSGTCSRTPASSRLRAGA